MLELENSIGWTRLELEKEIGHNLYRSNPPLCKLMEVAFRRLQARWDPEKMKYFAINDANDLDHYTLCYELDLVIEFTLCLL